VVNRNVADYALVAGVPARQIGWMSKYGEQLNLPLSGYAETVCAHTGERYILIGNQVSVTGKNEP
jgi:UDP-2-acetamido-3-amino-2,3-dideoxy-glucuronate N-acetyltransferase